MTGNTELVEDSSRNGSQCRNRICFPFRLTREGLRQRRCTRASPAGQPVGVCQDPPRCGPDQHTNGQSGPAHSWHSGQTRPSRHARRHVRTSHRNNLKTACQYFRNPLSPSPLGRIRQRGMSLSSSKKGTVCPGCQLDGTTRQDRRNWPSVRLDGHEHAQPVVTIRWRRGLPRRNGSARSRRCRAASCSPSASACSGQV
jgi:hypothetical protein